MSFIWTAEMSLLHGDIKLHSISFQHSSKSSTNLYLLLKSHLFQPFCCQDAALSPAGLFSPFRKHHLLWCTWKLNGKNLQPFWPVVVLQLCSKLRSFTLLKLSRYLALKKIPHTFIFVLRNLLNFSKLCSYDSAVDL